MHKEWKVHRTRKKLEVDVWKLKQKTRRLKNKGQARNWCKWGAKSHCWHILLLVTQKQLPRQIAVLFRPALYVRALVLYYRVLQHDQKIKKNKITWNFWIFPPLAQQLTHCLHLGPISLIAGSLSKWGIQTCWAI